MSKKKVEEITGFTCEIFGEEWVVEVREGPLKDPDLEAVSGFTDPDKNLIVVEKHPDKEFMRKVLFHELVHAAVSDVSTHGVEGKANWLPEEQVAELVGKMMNQLIVQAIILPPWVFNRGKV